MRVTIIHGHMNCIGRTVMMVDEFENSVRVHTYTINISLFLQIFAEYVILIRELYLDFQL